MEELDSSVLVYGVGDIITTSFDRPISVKNKALALKSIMFSGSRSGNNGSPLLRYRFLVEDNTQTVHSLYLPLRRWQYYETNELMEAIYNALLDLAKQLNSEIYIVDRETDESFHAKLPRFIPGYGRQYPTIDYLNSGLKIVHSQYTIFSSDWSRPDNVWRLFFNNDLSNNSRRLVYSNTTLNVPGSGDGGEGSSDDSTTTAQDDAIFIFCNVVKPSYFGNVKERILDLININFPNGDGVTTFINNNLLFHKFSVDELQNLEFYFLTIDGALLSFVGKIVLHLVVKESS